MHKVVCIAGMAGSGKSVISDFFVSHGFQFIRFGQVVLDEIKNRGLKPNEKIEKEIREGLRTKHGMAVMAKLIIPKVENLLKTGNVVADGLYSFSEYKEFKKTFGKQFVLVAVYAPPSLRYERISSRVSKNDPDLRHRAFTKKEARQRDYSEIENIEKGGPIAMADFTILNTKDKKFALDQAKTVLTTITRNVKINYE